MAPNAGVWWNGELQHYTSSAHNSYVADGMLNIVARREAQPFYGGSHVPRDFTSARLLTRRLFGPGRLEVRARMPSSLGTWPAIWALGTDAGDDTVMPFPIDWPLTGELDIMEQYLGNTSYFKSAMHFRSVGPSGTAYPDYLVSPERATLDLSENFYTYAMEWTADRVTFLVDGAAHFTVTQAAVAARGGIWPFAGRQVFLLLNVAVGGSLGGAVPDSFINGTMVVDWVRYYSA